MQAWYAGNVRGSGKSLTYGNQTTEKKPNHVEQQVKNDSVQFFMSVFIESSGVAPSTLGPI